MRIPFAPSAAYGYMVGFVFISYFIILWKVYPLLFLLIAIFIALGSIFAGIIWGYLGNYAREREAEHKARSDEIIDRYLKTNAEILKATKKIAEVKKVKKK